MNGSSPLQQAKLTIELDTQEAQARLDELEERLDDLVSASDDQEDELEDHERRTTSIGRQNREREAKQKPGMENTGPGKFGLRNIPAILTGADMAGFVGGTIGSLLPIGGGGIGPASRKAFELEQEYGQFAQGILDTMLQKAGLSEERAKKIDLVLDTMHKGLADFDKRLKSLFPTVENVIEMTKAQMLTGGHLNPEEIKNFARASYEWNFVQQRKSQDIRDKTLRMLGEEAPDALNDVMMRILNGKMVP